MWFPDFLLFNCVHLCEPVYGEYIYEVVNTGLLQEHTISMALQIILAHSALSEFS